jgi:hypothetical protein
MPGAPATITSDNTPQTAATQIFDEEDSESVFLLPDSTSEPHLWLIAEGVEKNLEPILDENVCLVPNSIFESRSWLIPETKLKPISKKKIT